MSPEPFAARIAIIPAGLPEFVEADFEKLTDFLTHLLNPKLRFAILNALYQSSVSGPDSVAYVLNDIFRRDLGSPWGAMILFSFLKEISKDQNRGEKEYQRVCSLLALNTGAPPSQVSFLRRELEKIMVLFLEKDRIFFEREILGLSLPLSEHIETPPKARLERADGSDIFKMVPGLGNLQK
jgi:hypothetical protein